MKLSEEKRDIWKQAYAICEQYDGEITDSGSVIAASESIRRFCGQHEADPECNQMALALGIAMCNYFENIYKQAVSVND